MFHQRITNTYTIAEMQEARDTFGSIARTAEYLGISKPTVAKYTTAQDVYKNSKLSPTQINKIFDDYALGLSIKDIAEDAGCTTVTVNKYIKKRSRPDEGRDKIIKASQALPASPAQSAAVIDTFLEVKSETITRIKGRDFNYIICADDQGGAVSYYRI